MKFILIAAGKIAERFSTDLRFKNILETNLVGIITSKPIYTQLHNNLKNIKYLPSSYISVKRRNEVELSEMIKMVNPDYIISIQYPWILPKEILESVSNRVLNLHNARLPEYRGYNTISHEILNCETLHTTTLHWVSEEVDMGKIVTTRDIFIDKFDTAFSLWSRSSNSALDLLYEWFQELNSNLIFPMGNDVPLGGCYYSKEIDNFKIIPNKATTQEIDKFARAFYFPPHEPAYFKLNNKKLYVLPDSWNFDLNK